MAGHAMSASSYPIFTHDVASPTTSYPLRHPAPPLAPTHPPRAQGLVGFVTMAAAAAAIPISLCSVSVHLGLRPTSQTYPLCRSLLGGQIAGQCRRPRLTVLAAAGKPPGEAEEQVPAWAKPGADEPPPWEREGGAVQGQEAGQVPFYAYLLASAITAIAAIGSIFEYTNQRPVFGIVGSDSALYAPLLGFFVFTGVPTSAFLWFKAVQTANREAEEQDRRDGFQ